MTAKWVRLVGLPAILAALITLAAPRANAGDLTIGVLWPVTGPLAQIATDSINGFQMYLDEHKGNFHGATVKLIVADTQAKPATAVLQAEKLIKQNHVNMLIGGVLASTGYALAPVSTREKVVYISSIAASDDLTQRDAAKYPYFVRTGWSSSQPEHPFGEWACRMASRRSSRSRRITLSAMKRSAAFSRALRRAAARSSRRCGRRSARPTSRLTSARSSRTRMLYSSCRWGAGPCNCRGNCRGPASSRGNA